MFSPDCPTRSPARATAVTCTSCCFDGYFQWMGKHEQQKQTRSFCDNLTTIQKVDAILDIVEACQSVGAGTQGIIRNLSVSKILHESGRSVWTAADAHSSIPIVCTMAPVRTALSVAQVAEAIHNASERLKWDASSFSGFEVLCEDVDASDGARNDTVYYQIVAPKGAPFSDRDLVQERCILSFPDDTHVIAMHSVCDEVAARMGKPPTRKVVRATTLLMAYILQPMSIGHGVMVISVSQMDPGGYIPGWMQRVAQEFGKAKFMQWVDKLEAHCNSQEVEPAADQLESHCDSKVAHPRAHPKARTLLLNAEEGDNEASLFGCCTARKGVSQIA
eukprot:TRINITY_DN58499_c0_g1_i1.p1 TRINITY_DN58499_c0_g1~~TRINITY_DN58499_c0_g1_i1.p1  ORF type:complete len:333 (+),score=40.68 TRINITY_DN58499_c0_g1_i1:154-1152(+)